MSPHPSHLLDIMEGSPDPVIAMRAAFEFARMVSTPQAAPSRNRFTWMVTRRAAYVDDYLYRTLALHVLGLMGGDAAVEELRRALHASDGAQPYAAGALAGHVSPKSVAPLLRLLQSEDSFTRFEAAQTMRTISPGSDAAEAVSPQLRSLLGPLSRAGTRVAAAELLSELPGEQGVHLDLLGIAADLRDDTQVRAACIRALGDLRVASALPALIELAHGSVDDVQLAAVDALGEIGGDTAEHALCDVLAVTPRSCAARDAMLLALQRLRRVRAQPATGLTIAQFTFPGTIDRDLVGAGRADNGGISTLLLSLGRALARRSDVAHVYTISRGDPTQADGAASVDTGPDGSTLVRLPIGHGEQISSTDLWPYPFQIERELERYFSTQPAVDALHLRFANAGTEAAARWARRHNIPLHFTLAPDPYVPLQRAMHRGDLSRASFETADRQERYVYRAQMLEWMARHADGLALLPRERWNEDARTFFGLDLPHELSRSNGRASIVAEGIELPNTPNSSPSPESARWITDAFSPGYGHGFAPHRRGLPVIVSIGRLHPVKGMGRLARAWATNPALAEKFNLVIVGGNLGQPSRTERCVLDEIEEIVTELPTIRGGLVLTGAQPHSQIASQLASLRLGVPGVTAPHALYVCASEKEEFGLAILEAMAAGLIVVAPYGGGPSTYIQDGVAGLLADTSDSTALARTLQTAARIRARPDQRETMTTALAQIVASRYSIDRMAAELTELYGRPLTARQRVS